MNLSKLTPQLVAVWEPVSKMWPVWRWLWPVSVSLTSNSHLQIEGTTFSQTLTAGSVGWLFAGLVWLILTKLFHPRTERETVFAVLTLLVLVSLSRSLIANLTMVTLGSTINATELAMRAFWGMFQFSFAIAVVGLLVLRVRTLRKQRRDAVASSEINLALQSQSSARLAQVVDDFKEMVSERLLPLIEQVDRRLGKVEGSEQARELAAQVRQQCESEVRAVSHEFALAPEPLHLPVSLTVPPSALSVLRSCLHTVGFYPGWSSAVGLAMLLPLTFLFSGFQGFLSVLAAALVSYGVAAFINSQPRPRIVYPGWRLVAAHALWLAFSATLFTAVLSITPLPRISPRLFNSLTYSIPLGMLLIWLTVNLVIGTYRASVEALANLHSVAAQLEQTVAQLERQHRQLREAHAKLLHGPIQGRLSAVSLALSMHASQPNAKWLEDAHAQLAGARKALSEALTQDVQLVSESDQPLNEVIGEVTKQWQGLLDVMLTISPNVEALCEEMPELVAPIRETVSECLLNSVRHSKSRRASIFVDVVTQEGAPFLHIDVTDDGVEPLTEQQYQGLGGRLLTALGAKRDIVVTDVGTRVKITWPVTSSSLAL